MLVVSFFGAHAEQPNERIDGDWVLRDGGLFDYIGDYDEVIVLPKGITKVPSELFGMGTGHDFIFTMTTIVIPEGVTEIEPGAFDWCLSLERVVLPYTLKTIGAGAFSGCVQLKQIVLPPSIETIGDFAFDNCSMLEELVLPDGLKYIGDGAFFHCAAMRSITIPDSVEYIGYDAFQYAGGKWSGDVYDEINPVPPDFIIYSSVHHKPARYAAWTNETLHSSIGFGGEPERFDKNPAWVDTAYLLYSDTGSASLYNHDGTEVVATFPNGTPVRCHDYMDDEWAYVYNADLEGFARISELTPVDPLIGSTKVVMVKLKDELKIYEDPNTDSAFRYVTIDDAYFNVKENLLTWLKVETGDRQEGYVSINDVGLIGFSPYEFTRDWGISESYYAPYDPTNDAGCVYLIRTADLSASVRMYTEPSDQSAVLGHFFAGTQVRVMDGSNDENRKDRSDDEWVLVRIEGLGVEGYVTWGDLFPISVDAHPDSIAY
jgi:hypothetical protein